MRAIVIPEPWKAVTAEREVPVPKQGEVLLKMVCGGICGSDLASYRGQSAYVSYPRTIGHEFAAEVVEVGENPYGIKKRNAGNRKPVLQLRNLLFLQARICKCLYPQRDHGRTERRGVQRLLYNAGGAIV